MKSTVTFGRARELKNFEWNVAPKYDELQEKYFSSINTIGFFCGNLLLEYLIGFVVMMAQKSSRAITTVLLGPRLLGATTGIYKARWYYSRTN